MSDRWKGVFLRAATSKETGYLSAPAREDLIGKEGVALTDFRPSGTAQVDGERVDVVSDTGFIAKGERVRIIRSEGYRHVVEVVADMASV